MTVESNNAIAVSSFSDWLKKYRVNFFNWWEATPKAMAPCTRNFFSRALSQLQVISRNSDCLIMLFLCLLWLIGVITLILIFWQSFENHCDWYHDFSRLDCCSFQSLCLLHWLSGTKKQHFQLKTVSHQVRTLLTLTKLFIQSGSELNYWAISLP